MFNIRGRGGTSEVVRARLRSHWSWRPKGLRKGLDLLEVSREHGNMIPI